QVERNRLALRQAQEQQRVTAARLAQVLHLDATVELVPNETDLAPLSLIKTNMTLDGLVGQALVSRPELQQSKSLLTAARRSKEGAVYGPMVPSLGSQIFLGGMGGGRNSSMGNFGDTDEYFFGLTWRFGPGGLFDRSRIQAAESRMGIAQLTIEKVKDDVFRQVVEGHTRTRSLADQFEMAERALGTAEEGYKLSK